MNNEALAGLYLHIPFCRSKCLYCDFYSVASTAAIPVWLDAVQREVPIYRESFPKFDSLYLGGGTPTVLGDRELAILIECLRRHFEFDSESEITIEANPDDVSAPKLRILEDLGINRISLGVQSLDDRELKYLGRSHDARQALKALDLLRSCGFARVGVDLMYGLEGESISGWKRTMDRVLEFRPEHLSCYQLTLEKSSPLGKRAAAGRLRTIIGKWESAFFLFTSRYLERHGYRHYEISNFALSRATRCRHNLKYWGHVPYLGLGPSAHSFQAGSRWWNVRSIKQYCRLLAEGKAPVESSERLTRDQLDLEALALGLRTSDGVSLPAMTTGPSWEKAIQELRKADLARLNNGRLQPTRKGFLVADSLPLMLFSQIPSSEPIVGFRRPLPKCPR